MVYLMRTSFHAITLLYSHGLMLLDLLPWVLFSIPSYPNEVDSLNLPTGVSSYLHVMLYYSQYMHMWQLCAPSLVLGWWHAHIFAFNVSMSKLSPSKITYHVYV